MNFSFICAMIFMMGSLDLIHTEPYPKSNFEKHFLNKPRKLEGEEGKTNYMVIKYGIDVDFSWDELDGVSFVMDGNQIQEQIRISAGTKIEIHFSSARDGLADFFRSHDRNYGNIISVDLSNFDSSNLGTINELFISCSSLKIANLSNINGNKFSSLKSVFDHNNALEILDLSNVNMASIDKVDSFFSSSTKLRYLNIKGASFSSQVSQAITTALDNNLNIICKDEGDTSNTISKGNTVNTCCDFDAKTDKCESSNYIKIYYGDSNVYSEGFIIEENDRNPEDISFIIHSDSILLSTQVFTVNNGSIVEVYFKKSLSSLKTYFHGESKITSIDFSHFDASKVNSLRETFVNCESLKAIDLSYFKTSKISEFERSFSSCANLEYLNLSHIAAESINNADNMFVNCPKLKILDISGFNIENIVSYSGPQFEALKSLKYINIKDTYLDDNSIEAIKKIGNDLTICQDRPILVKKGYKYFCLSYENGEEIYKASNSIIAYFNGDNNQFQFGEDYLDAIDYVISGDSSFKDNSLSSPITVGSEMYIFFKSSNPTALEGFFKEKNNIISVDLSYFVFSSVNSFKSLFEGCSDLKSVNFSNIATSLITNMESMFQNCENLESIDLSNIKTDSSVVINSLFKGCTSLKMVDISGLDLSSVQESSEVLTGTQSLKYINMMDIKASEGFKAQLKSELNEKEDLKVCQSEPILDGDNIISICCFFNIENGKCESMNYIVVYYGKDIVYGNGFTNEYRNDVRYIIIDDSIYAKDQSFRYHYLLQLQA